MSRSSISLLRSISTTLSNPSSSTTLRSSSVTSQPTKYSNKRRTILTNARAPRSNSDHSRRQQPTVNTLTANTKSIDHRILSGVDGFIPKESFDLISQWQAGLWERLQGQVRSNVGLAPIKAKWDKSGLDMTELIDFTSRDPKLALAFNHASLLLNNSFFLEGINAEETQPVPEQFRGLEDKVEAYAEGIVGGGWLWLVKTGDSQAEVDIIPTFASGTILVTSRTQRGRSDLPVFLTPPTSSSAEESTPETETTTTTTSSSSSEPISTETTRASSNPFSLSDRPDIRSGGSGSISNRNAVGGYPIPLAVLSLYEHTYLGPYGVWGRRAYASDWWRSLDWAKVLARSSKL